MRRFLFALITLFFMNSLAAQIDTAAMKKNIHSAMDSLQVLFKAKDWEKYAEFMHPDVITTLGGKGAFTEMLSSQMKMLDNLQIDVYRPGQVMQLLKEGQQYQGIVESFMQMQVMGNMVSGTSYEIVTSEDGIKWNFTRIDERGPEGLKQIISNLSNSLKFPKSKLVPGITLEEFLKDYAIEYY